MYFPSLQRMTVKQVHIDHHRKRVQVGGAVSMFPVLVPEFKMFGGQDFRGNKISSAYYIRWIQARDNEPVNIDDGGSFAHRINQYIFIREIRVCKSCSM